MTGPILLAGQVLDDPMTALVNVPNARLEILGDRLEVARSQVTLTPGDRLIGTRDRALPAPWWWTVGFELSSGELTDVGFIAPGVGSFLGWLAKFGWDVEREQRAFVATFRG